MSLQEQIRNEKNWALDKRDRLVSQIDKLRVELDATNGDLVKWSHAEEMIERLRLSADDFPATETPVNGATEPKRRGRRKGSQNRVAKPKHPPVLLEGSLGAETLRIVRSFGEEGATLEMITIALHASGRPAKALHVGKSLTGHRDNGRLIARDGRWYHPDFADGPETGESDHETIERSNVDDDGYPIAAATEEYE